MTKTSTNETNVDVIIQDFQKKFGILDEKDIVADDDYESSLTLDYEDMNRKGE